MTLQLSPVVEGQVTEFDRTVDDTLDANLYVFADASGARYTVFGGGYRTGVQKELDVKDDVIKNITTKFGWTFTGEELHIKGKSDWAPTHTAPVPLIEQILFGVYEELVRKEA